MYDKGVEAGTRQGVYDLLMSYRSGDMWAPRVDQTEALELETRYFLECVASGKTPINDGRAGLRVVRMLEAADLSLKHRRDIALSRRTRVVGAPPSVPPAPVAAAAEPARSRFVAA